MHNNMLPLGNWFSTCGRRKYFNKLLVYVELIMCIIVHKQKLINLDDLEAYQEKRGLRPKNEK